MTSRVSANRLIANSLVQFSVVYGAVFAAGSDDSGRDLRVAVITEANGPHLGIYFRDCRQSSVPPRLLSIRVATTFQDAERSFGNLKAFGTYRDATRMLKDFQPDLVLVALPAHKSPDQIRAALDAGCRGGVPAHIKDNLRRLQAADSGETQMVD